MRHRFAVLSIVVASLFSVSCARDAVRAAESGDSARLRTVLLPRHQRGEVSNGEAACLARAVAARELRSAKNEASALGRVHDVRACSLELDEELEERMQTHDGVGAEVALVRLENGTLREKEARDYLGDADDRWRAVGTRTLHREGDRKRRQEAMLDPSPRVRRSAIRASGQAREIEDLDVLFETARVDPELLLRNEAIRAMSQILRATDDKPRAATQAIRLRDLHSSGDDALREEIAVAWALAPVFENGGRDALRVEIAAGKGPGAIAAAAVVLRNASGDTELASASSALLTRTITEGSLRDRLHAIVSARLVGTEREVLRKAADEQDRAIKLAALARLLDSPDDRGRATRDLQNIAALGAYPTADVQRAELATRARLILAQAGDRSVQAWVERELAGPEPGQRLGAASALAAMGRSGRAVLLLADADASVRTRAACTMLVAARR